MSLPEVPLRRGEVTIAGQAVAFRSLSRHEAIELAQRYEGREDEAEDFMLACALDVTPAEVAAWRNATDIVTAQPLIDAVIAISGLDRLNGAEPAEDASGPKG